MNTAEEKMNELEDIAMETNQEKNRRNLIKKMIKVSMSMGQFQSKIPEWKENTRKRKSI